ncbi:virulence-associated E family protein [Rhizobium sp. PL01]|uniref:virulence-associated E family protein n=1 Tax=Rhizobium sp. PL01 TaxID=3085631 RepID=UPI00298127D2|nr:virulence-associated E family protein [Rhizobium sp. PL01]MDW5315494.1 virulence-associated E family protein [Rhizobium sp. PL01]
MDGKIDSIQQVAKKSKPKKAKRARNDWRDKWRLDPEKFEPYLDTANVIISLQENPRLIGRYAYDEMLRTVVIDDDGTFRRYNDTDTLILQNRLQLAGLAKMSKANVRDGVEKVARDFAFHPVRDWLDSLKWDGKPRVFNWLHYYLGAKHGPYTSKVGEMFLIGMVARIYQPGCKNDYMMVLEGEQGIFKSKACQVLGGDYFSDSLPDVTNDKECSVHLRDKWLIEIAELSSLSKSDSSDLKAFITRQHEQYRPPYGRDEVHEPRQCTFVGTTNDDTYLRDGTGGRRFWPIQCGTTFDLIALAKDRDQLFAEAVHLYRSGAHWWPDRAFEAEFMKPEQSARRVADAWEVPMETFLKGRQETTVYEIAKFGLDIDKPKIGTADQRRISAILQFWGWKRGKVNSNGRQTFVAPNHQSTFDQPEHITEHL